ncbi:S-adenosyl-L-methionine-dependent methyltransferase [Calocera cornea HHB12733]|uniref:peptide chain release factor N(5)-glutamine methyltransferase n=1 Tax=Calocera cornea HHB12733 TaxID=1353952 RepID=A0A165H5U6_9BASI|nr:S-adenosyl-L-methionine-dependent methyltransferase [Calocera cornea HHB12733]
MRPRVKQVENGLIAALGRSQALQEIRWMRSELLKDDGRRDAGGADARLESWINRRTAGEPLQYILGSQPFGPLDIITRRPVLIPRPETEEWVRQLSARFDLRARGRTVSVLDLCTGTGCIPLMLCHIWPRGQVRVLGVDVSADAVALAKENLEKNGSNGNEADFLRGDMFDDRLLASLSEKGKFDIITCNPPYIPSHEYAKLSKSVKEWEDPRALVGDYPLPEDRSRIEEIEADGLRFYSRLADIIPGLLVSKDGMAVLEFGIGQGSDVMNILRHLFREAELWKDQFGKERAFAGWT